MRNQADTAKLLADNATLMRLRGRGVLETVACVRSSVLAIATRS